MLGHHGDAGLVVADAIADLAEVQHRGLIEERLAGYLAGSDAVIDVGRDFGVVSQPDPIEIRELGEMTAEERADFAATVVEDLERLAADVGDLSTVVAEQPVEDDRWLREIRDGFAIDELRAVFVAKTLRAVLATLAGGDGEALLGEAETALEEARAVVARRHQDLHYPDPALLTAPQPNPTIYPFGYLEKADTLCYWERERVFAANVVRGEDERVPGCVD
jgi:hypothetical protein